MIGNWSAEIAQSVAINARTRRATTLEDVAEDLLGFIQNATEVR